MPGHERRRTRPPEHKSLAAKYAPKGFTQNPLAAAKARAAAAAAAGPVTPTKKPAGKADHELTNIDETVSAMATDGKQASTKAAKKVAGPQLDSSGQVYITLAQVLKKYHLATTGGAAKHAVRAGGITVNGTPEARPGRKLHTGDVVIIGEQTVTIDLLAQKNTEL
jgi:ribosome-associated protein